MVLSGCRLVPKGRLNVILGVCRLVQIDKNLFKQICKEKLDLGVREHSLTGATTSQITSAQEVFDPFRAATGPPHSVRFGAWILLRPARNSIARKGIGNLFAVLRRSQALVSGARKCSKVIISLMLTISWANMAKSRSSMSSQRGISKYCPKWLAKNNLLIPYTFSTPPLR